MGAEMRSRTAKCGQKWKILKFCIFHFSDFIDRFYIITYGPDLLIARGTAHRSRSTRFILSPQVAGILSDNPLARFRTKISAAPKIFKTFSVRNSFENERNNGLSLKIPAT